MGDLPDPVCADCVSFTAERRDDQGVRRGGCRFRPEMGSIPETLPYCHVFEPRPDRIREIALPQRTRSGRRSPGRSARAAPSANTPRRATLRDPVTGDTTGEISMDRDGLKQVLRELLQEETMYGYPEVGRRWQGGKVVLQPGAEETQSKEVPLDTFFSKIVMVRDRLRVLEAKINGNDSLSATEKVELQGYISRCYGSLTTFNVLFANKEDQFSSK